MVKLDNCFGDCMMHKPFGCVLRCLGCCLRYLKRYSGTMKNLKEPIVGDLFRFLENLFLVVEEQAAKV